MKELVLSLEGKQYNLSLPTIKVSTSTKHRLRLIR